MSSFKSFKQLPPISLPVIFFGLAVISGTLLLHEPMSLVRRISWTDALFTTTSAVCVTGLTVVDTGQTFSRYGQAIIMILIQIGGLGIMTFTSLAFYLVRQRVSLTDKIAIGQGLVPHSLFSLSHILKAMLLGTLFIEGSGALLLYFAAPSGSFPPFSALFHAVSAFCNAGFALQPDNLTAWRGNWPVNIIFMTLIVSGGLGFSVLLELFTLARGWFSAKRPRPHLTWYAGIVLKTSFWLIIGGWLTIFLAEFIGFHRYSPTSDAVLVSLFQSVTCRTAGFNTMNIHAMTNVSLFIMVILMFIGGAPGSCAGGIKVTTFRTILSFIASELKGRTQVRAGRFAISGEAVKKALVLVIFSGLLIIAATLILSITEGGDLPHPQTRGLIFEILFEAVSAFGTVGLSTGLTPHLSMAGKWIITALMFIGRLGPLIFLASISAMRREELYQLPEEEILIG
ncbi:TrkH family potassium uptake protein [Desulfobacterota bacterium M19]